MRQDAQQAIQILASITAAASQQAAAAVNQTAGAISSITQKVDNSVKQITNNTTKLDNSVKNISNTTTKIDNSIKIISNDAQRAQIAMNGLRQTTDLLGGAGLALSAGLGAAVKTAAQFDGSMQDVRAITRLSSAEFDKLKTGVLQIAQNPLVRQGPSELAKGLYEVLSAGIPANRALDVLRVGAIGAGAGLSTTSQAVSALTTVLNSGISGVASASDAMDILLKIVEQGKTHFPELASSINRVLPTAANFGISMQEVAGSIITMTQKGDSADKAITGLNAVIRSITSPSKSAKDAMNALGIEYGVNALKARGLTGILAEIATKTGGAADKIKAVFGNRGIAANAGFELLSNQGKNLAKNLNLVSDKAQVTGTTTHAAAEQAKAADKQFAKLQQTEQLLGITVGNTLLPYFTKFVGAAKEALDWFNRLDKQTQDGTVKLVAFAAAVLTGIGVLGRIVAAANTARLAFIALEGSAILAGEGMAGAMLATLGPIGLVVAALGAAFFAFQRFKQEFITDIEQINKARFQTVVDTKSGKNGPQAKIDFYKNQITEAKNRLSSSYAQGDSPLAKQLRDSNNAAIARANAGIKEATAQQAKEAGAAAAKLKANPPPSLKMPGNVGGLPKDFSEQLKDAQAAAKGRKKAAQDAKDATEERVDAEKDALKELRDLTQGKYENAVADAKAEDQELKQKGVSLSIRQKLLAAKIAAAKKERDEDKKDAAAKLQDLLDEAKMADMTDDQRSRFEAQKQFSQTARENAGNPAAIGAAAQIYQAKIRELNDAKKKAALEEAIELEREEGETIQANFEEMVKFQEQEDKAVADGLAKQREKEQAEKDAITAEQAHYEKIQDFMYRSDAMSIASYRQVLRDRLEMTQQYSDEWIRLAEQIQGLDEQQARQDNENSKREFDKKWGMVVQVSQGVKGVFENALSESFNHGFKNFFKNILQGFTQMLEQMVEQWLAKMAIMGIVNLVTGGGGAASGIFRALGFDDAHNDRQAKHFGFDYMRHFSEGTRDYETQRGAASAPGRSGAVAGGITIAGPVAHIQNAAFHSEMDATKVGGIIAREVTRSLQGYSFGTGG